MPPLNLCTYATSTPAQAEDNAIDLDLKLFEVLLDKISRIQDEHGSKLAKLLTDSEETFEKILIEVQCPFIKSSNSASSITDLPDNERTILLIIWGLMESPQAKAEMRIESLEKLANLLIISANFEADLREVHRAFLLGSSDAKPCPDQSCLPSAGVLAVLH
jgi:hypothetical protein